DLADEVRDALRLVLLIAIHGDDPVIPARVSVVKRIDDALPVSAVHGMPDETDVGALRQNLGGAIGAAVVDAEDIGCVLSDFVENFLDILPLIEDRNGDQQAHAMLPR